MSKTDIDRMCEMEVVAKSIDGIKQIRTIDIVNHGGTKVSIDCTKMDSLNVDRISMNLRTALESAYEAAFFELNI